MIAKIVKVKNELLDSSEGAILRSCSYNLPLFSIIMNDAYSKELSEYVLQLWLVFHDCRYPAWPRTISEDDLKKINAYLDWVIDAKLDYVEFEL